MFWEGGGGSGCAAGRSGFCSTMTGAGFCSTIGGSVEVCDCACAVCGLVSVDAPAFTGFGFCAAGVWAAVFGACPAVAVPFGGFVPVAFLAVAARVLVTGVFGFVAALRFSGFAALVAPPGR